MPADLNPLPETLLPGGWPTALAPMQDVTDGPFFRLLGRYGVPDYFFTEFSRVHVHSRIEPAILEAIEHHGTGRPLFVQLMGESLSDLKRTVEALRDYPIAGVDLNVGCPVPKVYKRNVGGGLLRDLPQLDRILGCLREAVEGPFTVKMRLGFADTHTYPDALSLINKHRADLLSLHGRTVAGGYKSEVNYDLIKLGVESVGCPVFANGNVECWEDALRVKAHTGAWGIMVGRSAIRNPWIFRQIHEVQSGNEPFQPKLKDVRVYISDLWESRQIPGLEETRMVARMKKFLNFVGLGVDPEGAFLYAMRRTRTEADLFTVCDQFLLEEGRGELPFAERPYTGLVARPNCETVAGGERESELSCDSFALAETNP
jgi:tRNA-dihydrouridine synthase B